MRNSEVSSCQYENNYPKNTIKNHNKPSYSTWEENNEQLYIKSRKKINNCNTRAGGLAWLRYRLDMESSNDVDHYTNTIDKQQLVTMSDVTTHSDDSVGPDEILWKEYKGYLNLKVSKITASNLFRYAQKYCYILTTNNASDLQLLTQEKRIHIMKALSSLSKFLGVHEKWKKLIENFDLKWTNNETANNTFFRIFDNNNNDINKMILWVKEAMNQLPKKYCNILLFAALTGLRPSECWYSIRLIQNEKERYVNNERLILSHYKYPEIFLRRTKKAYITLISEYILEIAENSDIRLPYAQLCKILKSKNISMNMYYCRKIFATFLRNKGIEPEVIDLLQGRIPKSIFLRHYYRPDINEIITKKIRPVLGELMDELVR